MVLLEASVMVVFEASVDAMVTGVVVVLVVVVVALVLVVVMVVVVVVMVAGLGQE